MSIEAMSLILSTILIPIRESVYTIHMDDCENLGTFN